MALILAVDDEPEALGSIRRMLNEEGHEVLVATGGQPALKILKTRQPDLIILDIMMPEMSGIEVCKHIRANPFLSKIPILFLTAKSQPENIVEGLDAGGDDYVTKPFQIIELPARIRALLRRAPSGTLDVNAESLSVGDIELELQQFQIHIDNQTYELTAIEHQLLYYLMLHAGKPQSVEQLLQNVWEYPAGTGDPALVYAHIKNLRRKFEPQPETPQYILNIRGSGYFITTSSTHT